MLNYDEIAQQAMQWSLDFTLPERQRRVAEQLAALSSILTDEQYGCPSEHAAANIMYRNLRHAFESRTDLSLPLFQARRERRTEPRYLPTEGGTKTS